MYIYPIFMRGRDEGAGVPGPRAQAEEAGGGGAPEAGLALR
jgi:hypothetical protein